MSKPMRVPEYSQLLSKIWREHNPILCSGNEKFRVIKYVDATFDNRTGHVFSVRLRGFGQPDGEFHVCNEQCDLEDSLYDRIVFWLEHK